MLDYVRIINFHIVIIINIFLVAAGFFCYLYTSLLTGLGNLLVV